MIFDADRILLSKLLVAGPFDDLPQPFFYYVAVGLTLLGLTLTAAGILGCWASCLHNYWLISLVRPKYQFSIFAVKFHCFSSKLTGIY